MAVNTQRTSCVLPHQIQTEAIAVNLNELLHILIYQTLCFTATFLVEGKDRE